MSLEKLFSGEIIDDVEDTLDDLKLVISKKADYLQKKERCHIIDLKFFKHESCDAIEEARGYGISYKLFCDTRDKFVVTPATLGCNKFSYVFDHESWGDCIDRIDEAENINYFLRLYNLGRTLSKYGFKVYLMGIDCSGRGYLNLYHRRIKKDDPVLTADDIDEDLEYRFVDKDYVIFVYH